MAEEKETEATPKKAAAPRKRTPLQLKQQKQRQLKQKQ